MVKILLAVLALGHMSGCAGARAATQTRTVTVNHPREDVCLPQAIHRPGTLVFVERQVKGGKCTCVPMACLDFQLADPAKCTLVVMTSCNPEQAIKCLDELDSGKTRI